MAMQEAIRQAEQRIKSREAARERKIQELGKLENGAKFDWTKVESASRLAERAKRLGMFAETGALLRDPTDTKVGARVYERILGANNLLDITFLSEGARKAEAVGRITLPVAGGLKLGTGFMVTSRVMMTNNHVLGDELEAGGATLEFDFFKREDGTTGPVTRFRLQPDALFVTDIAMDFTLVAVEATNADGVNLSARGWFPLIGPSGKAVVGERLSIIQHPNGDPQAVTVHDNKLVDVDDKFLHYKTDTMGGSSGSPVLNINWDLVALHHAAVANSNEGVRISSIVTRLREMSQNEAGSSGAGQELLAEVLRGSPPSADNESGRPMYSGNSGPQPVHNGTHGNGPRVNADGSTSWIVPISVTVGVGCSEGHNGNGVLHAPSVATPSVRVDAEPPIDDAMLREAIEALEATEGRNYYSEGDDKKAIKNFYPSLDGLDKAQMYETLTRLLSDTHTTTLSYKRARLVHLYPWIDRRADRSRELRGLYSGQVFDALDVVRRESAMERRREQAIRERIVRESLDGVDDVFLEELEAANPFNCEHVVPQSWFNKRKQPKADLHHLFTCESGCNNFRGNRAYFDFANEAVRDGCGESGERTFEPKLGKGAAARATLYFLLRYPGEIADSGKEMPKDRLKTILKWSKQDKVSLWEQHRNAEIQKVQGNRNPFIDFPELVDKIDFKPGWA